MVANSIEFGKLNQILLMKIELLCNGVIIQKKLIGELKNQGNPFNLGRKDGAGPAGGRYFRFSNGSIINTPIWIDKHHGTNLVITNIDSDDNILIKHTKDPKFPIIPLQLIKTPNFYSEYSKENISFKKIALMHGDRTLATTINQRCTYWRKNQQCRFCGIEFSLNNNTTIEIKTGSQINEVIKAARQENPLYAQHMTLTIGTQSTSDKGMQQYINIIKKIKKSYPNMQIHIQVEPMDDKKWYYKVKRAGADTIGIHIEILDDEIRKRICPGKSLILYATYIEHWKKAIEIFGINQVNTFILTGFDNDLAKFKLKYKYKILAR